MINKLKELELRKQKFERVIQDSPENVSTVLYVDFKRGIITGKKETERVQTHLGFISIPRRKK